MEPPAPDGGQYVVLMVDTFSKWVEIAAIPDKSAASTTRVLHECITCRHGIPTDIRTDRGTEYRGAFDDYCKFLGIRHAYISTAHPRANGQAERIVRTFKTTLVRLLEASPHLKWYEILPDVARGMRIIPAAATGFSLYLLVYK